MSSSSRAEWLARQGLPAGKRDTAGCLTRGWIYTGGGQLPYVGLYARGKLRRATVDEAVARGDAVEVLTVRSCTMLVGAADVPLALAAGREAFDTGPRAAANKVGVTDRELAELGEHILRALEAGPLEPNQLRGQIGPPLVRDLGEAGRKKGFSTTLPIALDALHVAGRVKRVSTTGRLDGARHRYQLWDPAPTPLELDASGLAKAIAARYLAWAAPATAKDLAWWADLGVREAAALGGAGEDDWLQSDEKIRARAPSDADVIFLPFRDNYTNLHRDLAPLVDERDAATPVLDWSRGVVPLAEAQSLHQHAIVIGGRIAGVWDFDADAAKLHWATFTKAPAKLHAAIDEAATEIADFVRDDLGDLRLYALDNAANRAHRLAYVQAAKFRGTA